MSEFRIKYNGFRFPMRQKRVDGTWGCRGCGGVIPKGRETWCSKDCWNRYEPSRVIVAVEARDKDICQGCGFDCKKAKAQWAQSKRTLPYTEWHNRRPPKAEYDHIIPFSEGGLTVLENMRTLCSDCHKKRTAEWLAAKARQRKVKHHTQLDLLTAEQP